MKKALIAVSVIAALLSLGMTYVGARSVDKARIAQLDRDLVRVQATRDSIETVVAYKDSLQHRIRREVALIGQEAERLRADVAELERDRQRQELEVRQLDSFVAEEERFLDTFPELARATRVVTETRNGFDLTFVRIPMAATETFVIDHQDALSYRAQRDSLLTLDSLQMEVALLRDSLEVLAEQKADAYRSGYEDAYARYEALNDEYVGVLKQPPRVSLFPGKGTAIISGALGVVVGAAASRISND